MLIRKCTHQDISQLAMMNMHLIEDEKSNNPMTLTELEYRMGNFISDEYNAYFFIEDDVVVGYALVKHTSTPLYLRQFYIKREFRRKHYGKIAFHQLMDYMQIEVIDIEVLPWNERGYLFWKSCGFDDICISMRYGKMR